MLVTAQNRRGLLFNTHSYGSTRFDSDSGFRSTSFFETQVQFRRWKGHPHMYECGA